jgi:hypothetical protein
VHLGAWKGWFTPQGRGPGGNTEEKERSLMGLRKHKQDGPPPSDQYELHPEYLRRKEAARFLGLSSGTLANWASAGQGPPVCRVRGAVLYAVADLREYVTRGRVEMVATR